MNLSHYINNNGNNTLIVVLGPTAVGKTSFSIDLATKLKTEIISADSRQIYKHMDIGTAKPSLQERQLVKHHLADCLELHEPYSIGTFINDANDILKELFKKNKYVVMTGGSNLYINVFLNGIDEMPIIDLETRKSLNKELKTHGLKKLAQELYEKDPIYYNKVDLNNPRRIIRALEICKSTGLPYSSFRKDIPGIKNPAIDDFFRQTPSTKKNEKVNFESENSTINKKKTYNVLKIGLQKDRNLIYSAINTRVDAMIKQGLVEEAQRLYKYKHLNSLQTIGYKELFDFFDKKINLNDAIELIKRNTRRYAKRQLTWLNKDTDIKWIKTPYDIES